jgi:serine protease Do/serine protease DegQ
MSKSISMKLKILFGFILLMIGFYGVNVYLGAKAPNETPTEGDGVVVEEKSTNVSAPLTVTVDKTEIDHNKSVVVTSYADSLEAIRPAVVSVYSTKVVKGRVNGFPFDDPLFRRFFGPEGAQPKDQVQQGLGSGVIVSADGYILTNNHVVEGADEIRVLLNEGKEVDAQVIGTDPRTDIAVLKIDEAELPHATLADSESLRVGDVVFAVGNPLGVGQTVTMGIVSATGRSNLRLIDGGYENFIQTDASINPGNSGGALVDAKGRVVGINTAIVSTSRGNIGIGFAVPINLAGSVMDSLIETGSVKRGFLGVNIQDMDPDLAAGFGLENEKGALVAAVSEGSPADEVGLHPGDVIVKVNEQSIDSSNDLRFTIAQMAPGSNVSLGYLRDGKFETVDIVLGTLEENAGIGSTEKIQRDTILEGIFVEALTDDLRKKLQIGEGVTGIVVKEIDPETPYRKNFAVGMVIEQINRQEVSNLRTAQEAMIEGRNLFYINIRGVSRYITVIVE